MNTKSTKAHSSTRSATTRRRPRRPSKAALLRIKIATIVGTAVLFLASLTGVAIYNPQLGSQTAVPVQSQQITISKQNGSSSIQLAPPPRVSAVRPLVRSRGS